MNPHDRDIGSCKALVIDANATSRSILVSMLRDMGFKSVVQTSKLPDARRHLEDRAFDVVLCDYHFERGEYTGQDLLDDLRRAQLLPFSTVFIMVTGEASYAKVAEAAESALDGYLLKPHNAATLGRRVHQARHRKFVLRDIFESIEAEEFEIAAARCLARFESRDDYWLYAARIGAELLLRLGRHDDARALFEAVTEANAMPWSRLGVARAQIEAGKAPQALRTLEALLAEDPTHADAFDVMGRVQVEQGDLEDALATYRKASALTPNSIARLQKQGMLAFMMGKHDEAAQTLERAVAIGITSKMFDWQTVVLLALTCFDKRDTRGLQRCLDNLAHTVAKTPGSVRLVRFHAVIDLFSELMDRRLAQVVRAVKALAGEVRDTSFDFEAACNLVASLARLRSNEIQLPDDDLWIGAIGQRFCVTKAAAELLAGTALSWPPYGEQLRAEQLGINRIAEQAMAHTIGGNPRATVTMLIERGRATLNPKLLDIARLSVQRHKARIPDADALAEQIEELRRGFCASGMQVQLGTSAGRQAGGLALRATAAAPDAGAAPALTPALPSESAPEPASGHEDAADLVTTDA